MTFSIAKGVNLAELRATRKLRSMAEFDPGKPARVYDYLNDDLFPWDPANAAHYRRWARPYKARPELIDYHGLELLGWLPTESS
jgi:hypothetical protein